MEHFHRKGLSNNILKYIYFYISNHIINIESYDHNHHLPLVVCAVIMLVQYVIFI